MPSREYLPNDRCVIPRKLGEGAQLNKKLPEMLKERHKPTLTQLLTVLKSQERPVKPPMT